MKKFRKIRKELSESVIEKERVVIKRPPLKGNGDKMPPPKKPRRGGGGGGENNRTKHRVTVGLVKSQIKNARVRNIHDEETPIGKHLTKNNFFSSIVTGDHPSIPKGHHIRVETTNLSGHPEVSLHNDETLDHVHDLSPITLTSKK